ncbi:MAG: hypothetical protein CK429_14045 [Mycobacterium sp.]|uniref:hypothetical protein n=1 Tax=Mycobacterium sp. TaxID=1785 RepID=UPI000CC34218|nr:hypothetical protein [Mycobacterium sp.]PJE01208.1 MAG: hypothetical protein CK428_31600 [Mycobacterium sp.]PJE13154.1 MAG: hypothetical protein CK429_14045 [Mycobacterium sp.]PJE22042.1 MAG: hypothetical protein CK431_18620 [Mycobacterium sp.]
MTLVQTLLTPRGVLQVSDRQLTDVHGRVHSSTANKAVIWCGHIVIGFSGIAYTDSHQLHPISEWIALCLRGARTLGDAVDALQQAGSHLMSQTDLTRRPLTMVVAGSPPGEGEVLMFAISNSLPTGAPAHHAESRFMRSNDLVVPLYGSDYRYQAIGVPLEPAVQRFWQATLTTIHQRFGLDHAARQMIAIQRRVRRFQIQRSRGATVGRSAMVVWLPAVPDPDPALTFIVTDPVSSAIQEMVPMYSFVAEYGFSKTRFGPHFVCDRAVGFDLQSGLTPPTKPGPPKQWSSVRVV